MSELSEEKRMILPLYTAFGADIWVHIVLKAVNNLISVFRVPWFRLRVHVKKEFYGGSHDAEPIKSMSI